ncbi:MAG: hypothetical protein AB7F22_14165 [Reyranella sp.]|uniref:hypothetical protein n=1 Tax=Reyranella sp. TaxID=1929291 RepID=UPI003D127B8E
MNDDSLLVGRTLVEFDRRDVPIWQERQSLWAEAGADAVSYGIPLDRLFGVPDSTHIAAHAPLQEVALPAVEGDPLVELATLSEALALAEVPLGLLDTPLSHDAFALAPLPDAWSGDGLGADWTFDL